MSSYEELYFYPGTHTHRNHFGIRDRAALARAEALVTADAMKDGLREPFSFTPEGFQAVHRQMFEGIYPWAGQFRSVDMYKIQSGGRPPVAFVPGDEIKHTALPLFCEQVQDDLTSPREFLAQHKEEFAYRAAVYLKDLNYIHPFPEGNGRVQRVFLDQLARQSGYELDQAALERETWLAASRESYTQEQFGEHRRMTALITGAIHSAQQRQDQTAPAGIQHKPDFETIKAKAKAAVRRQGQHQERDGPGHDPEQER
ncbi:MAG: Fic family protein [Gammaproteobacteria bacterium]